MRALTLSRALGVPICLALWLAVLCEPALAHAALVQESPAAGASLDQPPGQVRLTFSEPVDAEFDPLKVYDAEGNRVDEDDARVDPDDARVLLAGLEELPEGSYRVEWRVTSIDGHVIEDAYAFNVAAGTGQNGGGSQANAGDAGEQAAREVQDPASPEVAGGLDPAVLYGALIVGILGLVALVFVAVRVLRRRKSGGYNDHLGRVAGGIYAANPRAVPQLANTLVPVAVAGLALASLGDPAFAQGSHGGAHSGGVSSSEILGGFEHGITLAATVLLAGLAPFAALVWLPASKDVGAGRDAVRSFGPLAWVLLYVLVIAGVAEVSVYATVASGESLGLGLLWEALLDTRVGHVWLARLGFALLTAALITAAGRSGKTGYWWAATGAAALLLLTLTQLSHAAAEGRFLPYLADWLHVAAATVWAGGLLGFVFVFFSGSLEAVGADQRAKLREQAPRRFSRLAIGSVTVLAATGLYAILLHVPTPAALVQTGYGRVLLAKLALLALVSAVGAASFLLQGRGPFGRLIVAELVLALAVFAATGFLTSLPPATAVSPAEPAADAGALEVRLDPVGDSVTSGTATFREQDGSVYLELQASGLPEPGVIYFGEIHEGGCETGRQDVDPGAGYADAEPPDPDVMRFELLSNSGPEYAHENGHNDADVWMLSSAEGTGQVTAGLKDYGTMDELLSGEPKYLDLHAPTPGDPTVACGEIG